MLEKEKSIPMDKRISKSVSLNKKTEATAGSNSYQSDHQSSDSSRFSLDINSENVLLGIIYSEILGKPLSLRKR